MLSACVLACFQDSTCAGGLCAGLRCSCIGEEAGSTPARNGCKRLAGQRLLLLCVSVPKQVHTDIHPQSRNWTAIQFSNKWFVY